MGAAMIGLAVVLFAAGGVGLLERRAPSSGGGGVAGVDARGFARVVVEGEVDAGDVGQVGRDVAV